MADLLRSSERGSAFRGVAKRPGRVRLFAGRSTSRPAAVGKQQVRASGRPRSPNALTKEWTAAAAGLGVDVGLHALRHTHASALISKGVPITMISKRLGHASPNVTLAVYAKCSKRPTRGRPRQ